MTENPSNNSFDMQYTQRVIESYTVYSAHLQEERTMKVCLPPNFDPGRSYPVLYCHDGNEFFTHGRIATIANRLVAEGTLEPLLIVGIAVNASRRTDDYAQDGQRSQAYQSFVVEECLPFVEERYSVDTAKRFMAGVSLGAVASLAIAMQHPQKVQQLLLFSGAFYEVVQSAVREATGLEALTGYMLVGTGETALETTHGTFDLLQLNRRMRAALEAQGARIDYHEAEGTHIWGFWQRHLPGALAWLNDKV